MLLDVENITTILSSSTVFYLAEFAPLFWLVGGLVLALGIIGAIIDFFRIDDETKKSDNE